MSVWDTYELRNELRGRTKHDVAYFREIGMLRRKAPDSLSFHHVTIFNPEYGYNIESEEMRDYGEFRRVTIINSDNLNEKTIISLPGEDIELGSLVCWKDNHWLVTERDANNTIYTRAKLLQCNYLLRWVSEDKHIYEQWCAIEDGTKYLTGEMEDRNFVTTRGDSRIAMTISKNAKTVVFDRESRFLIDDVDSPHKLAYLLTKPLKLGLEYNDQGCFKFVLQEVTATVNDNHDLRIADYYKYFPREEQDFIRQKDVIDPGVISPDTGKEVWL